MPSPAVSLQVSGAERRREKIMESTTVDSTVAPKEVVAPPSDVPGDMTPPVGSGTIPKEKLDHALKDLHRFKDEARRLKEENETLIKNQMKEKSDYKSLAEKFEKELVDEKEKNKRLVQGTVYDKKLSAVQASLRAKGLRKEAEIDVERLDLSDIEVETTSHGRINLIGVEEFVERQKQLRPHWFQSSAPRINPGSPDVVNSSGDRITTKMLSDLYDKGARNGDLTAYRSALQQYQKQKHGG